MHALSLKSILLHSSLELLSGSQCLHGISMDPFLNDYNKLLVRILSNPLHEGFRNIKTSTSNFVNGHWAKCIASHTLRLPILLGQYKSCSLLGPTPLPTLREVKNSKKGSVSLPQWSLLCIACLLKFIFYLSFQL